MQIALNAQKLSFAQAYQAGGISRYIYHLLVELRRLPSAHRFAAFAPRVGHAPELGPTGSFKLLATGRRTEQPISRIIWEQLVLPLKAAGRCELVHGLAFATPLLWPGRSVVTIFDLSFLRHPELFNRGNRAYLTASTRIAARRADRVLTISRHGRQEVIDLLGVPPERVVTTYCAADARFRPLPVEAVAAFRARRGLPERFILYLGTLEPRKNVATLVRAYARLRDRCPSTPPLVLAGAPGWLYQDVYDTIAMLGLQQQVELPGFVPSEEQPLWYNAASVFVYPSLYEGFGLPPLEAMACGTPVVVSDTTSLPEVVGEAGLMVRPFDEQELASSIERILADRDLADRLSAAGLERATHFSWRRMALDTLACYDELAGRP